MDVLTDESVAEHTEQFLQRDRNVVPGLSLVHLCHRVLSYVVTQLALLATILIVFLCARITDIWKGVIMSELAVIVVLEIVNRSGRLPFWKSRILTTLVHSHMRLQLWQTRPVEYSTWVYRHTWFERRQVQPAPRPRYKAVAVAAYPCHRLCTFPARSLASVLWIFIDGDDIDVWNDVLRGL